MEYFELLPKDLKDEIEIYKRMSKINDEVLDHFINLHLDVIGEDTNEEKEKSINKLNKLFREIKLKAKMIDHGNYEYSLERDERQLISNEQICKLAAFVIKPLSGLDMVMENESLRNLGSNLRIVLSGIERAPDGVGFDIGVFQSLL